MKRLLLVLAAFFALAAPASAKTKPTIVLVHGAFADASGWNGVTERLQDRGYTVLVYVAAFAPAQGETVQTLSTPAGGSQLGVTTLDIHADGTAEGLEGTIKVSAFREVFAADLPRKLTSVMAVSQRPASLVTLGEPSGAPAWTSIPSWAVIPTKDNTIGTGNLRTMAKRAKAKITEVRGASHVVMTSQPAVTTDVILRAVRGN